MSISTIRFPLLATIRSTRDASASASSGPRTLFFVLTCS